MDQTYPTDLEIKNVTTNKYFFSIFIMLYCFVTKHSFMFDIYIFYKQRRVKGSCNLPMFLFRIPIHQH